MIETAKSPLLLATHGGPSADGAARIAALLALRLGAPLEVLSVLEPPAPLDYGYGVVVVADEAWIQALTESLREKATTQLARCGIARDVPFDLSMGAGSWLIADRARQRGAAAVVVGLGPHHLVDRAIGNETALHVAQVASTPVLAVPADATILPRRVLVAVDFTPSSLRALSLAASWLVTGDELIALHVAADSAPVDGPRARLTQLVDELPNAACIRAEPVVLHGEPGPTLLDLAERRNCDLIAMGSHGYGFWKRLALGSVASKLIRLSTRAVLVSPLSGIVAVQ